MLCALAGLAHQQPGASGAGNAGTWLGKGAETGTINTPQSSISLGVVRHQHRPTVITCAFQLRGTASVASYIRQLLPPWHLDIKYVLITTLAVSCVFRLHCLKLHTRIHTPHWYFSALSKCERVALSIVYATPICACHPKIRALLFAFSAELTRHWDPKEYCNHLSLYWLLLYLVCTFTCHVHRTASNAPPDSLMLVTAISARQSMSTRLSSGLRQLSRSLPAQLQLWLPPVAYGHCQDLVITGTCTWELTRLALPGTSTRYLNPESSEAI